MVPWMGSQGVAGAEVPLSGALLLHLQAELALLGGSRGPAVLVTPVLSPQLSVTAGWGVSQVWGTQRAAMAMSGLSGRSRLEGSLPQRPSPKGGGAD